jgi:hypothetical protein
LLSVVPSGLLTEVRRMVPALKRRANVGTSLARRGRLFRAKAMHVNLLIRAVAGVIFLTCSAALSQEPSKARVTTCDGDNCVSISEPASVSIKDLWKQADLIAVVQIVSGDTEHYKTAVYKAKVLRPLKGATAGQTVYLGKFIGYKLGGEYLAFLRSPRGVSEPIGGAQGYGSVEVFQIMYEGYSFMGIEYECVFDALEKHRCDEGVVISTEQVRLPKKIKTYPLGTNGGGGPHYMVRKDAFLNWLEQGMK